MYPRWVESQLSGVKLTVQLELVPMRLPSLDGQYQHEYLCLMPSDQTKEAQMAKEEEYEEVDPAQGWAALSHLDGKCLYSKQGWFTYS
jgi:protein OS-9